MLLIINKILIYQQSLAQKKQKIININKYLILHYNKLCNFKPNCNNVENKLVLQSSHTIVHIFLGVEISALKKKKCIYLRRNNIIIL